MKIVGHRAAKGLAPENSLKSFEKAIEHKVDAVEFDIRVTLDGKVIIHHDAFIQINEVMFRINETKYEALLKIKPDLLLLDDLLSFLIDKPLDIMPEIKPREPIQPIAMIFNKHIQKGFAKSRIQLASFNFDVLRQVKEQMPGIDLIVLESWYPFRAVKRAKSLDTKYISMNYRYIWAGVVVALSRQGFKLFVYTLDKPKKARYYAKHGLYGVITDYPDLYLGDK